MKQESHREIKRALTTVARREPNYPEAIAAARQLGFGCQGYRPRSLICRLLGFHWRVYAYRTCSSDGSWSITAECCPIHGIHTPRKRPTAAPPAPAPVAKPKVWDPPWEYGDSAFWLDPDLWNRTPMVGSRPDICWMHLDGPVLWPDANFTGERRAPPPLMRGSLSDMERKATRSWGVRVV